MKEIQLGYGTRRVRCAFDDDRFQVIESQTPDLTPLSDAEVGGALDSPISSSALEDKVSAGQSVLIVVSDATRATGSAQSVNLLTRRLIQNGIQPSDIRIIFATGIHRPVTPEEKLELLTPFIVQRIQSMDHDASDPTNLIDLGITKRGTRIRLNRALKDFRHVVIVGGIGFHYFAGFTGGRKSICPGLASTATVEATHMWAMDFDSGGRRAGVAAGLLDGNPVHEECENIAALIEPSFSLNTVVNENGRIIQIFAGHWREAHRRACAEYLADHSIEIPARRDVVIASCGGFPYDINLIQAHKTLDMAAHACRDGGTIILLAQCSDGFGRPDFLKWFEEPDSRALETRLRGAYEVNGQTAWALLTKAERFRVVLVSDLDSGDVSRMRMSPVHSLEEALAQIESAGTGYVIPRGAASLPIVKD
ncbi:MAG TPA: nickel-dependent lactate racemase [Pyrinomonadaceae bacterium]